jgi:hypothetical protein
MNEVRFPFGKSTIVYCDNRSAIQVVDHLVVHDKMKRAKLHAHYLR